MNCFVTRDLICDCFLSDADTSCPQEHLEQWDVTVPLRQCVSIHATVINPTYHCTLCVHAGHDDLNVDRRPPVVGTTRRLTAPLIIQAFGISNEQNFLKSRFGV